MANKDAKPKTILKNFFGKNEHFADVMNAVFFQGKEVVKPETLHELDSDVSSSIRMKEKVITEERMRDIVKKTSFGIDWMIIGIENQMKTHYGMPLRTMMYDGLNYVKQCEKTRKENKKNKRLKTADEFLSGIRREDKLKPVVTLVIYFGEEEWDGPLTLKDMLEQINPEIEPFVSDYHMNLLEVRKSGKYRFKNKEVDEVFRISRHIFAGEYDIIKKTYENRTISTEAAMAIGCITGSESLIQYAEKSGEEEENMKMCKALEELKEQGKSEGRLEGESRSFILIQKLFSENKIEEVKRVSEDKAYREEMYEKYGL